MDPFETSSFSSLIEREEREEVIQLDLHTAALIGDYDMVRDCIHKKSDLDHTNRGGWTPLMYAAYVGRDNILNMLLDAGARIDIQSKSVKLGSTALMLASYCATESIMYFLLQHGASINLRDGEGMTSLFHAVRQGHQSAVKLLASKGADLDLGQYLTGITPIMEAAISGHELIFNILLDHGADITRRTKKGETVKSLAMRHKNTSIVALIDKHISPQEPTRKEPTLELHDQFGASISSSGVIEGSIQDGPAIIDSLMRNAANSARNPDFSEGAPVASLCPEIQNKLSIQGQGGPPPQINNPVFQNEPPNQKRAQGILKPPIDVFNQNPPISALPPKLPDTLGELLAEYNLQMYLPKLEGEGLDVATFLELCDNDLKELGIDKFGPRKKMLLAIRECKERMAVHDPNIDQVQVDQYQVRIRDLTMHLQQALAYCKNYQTQLYQEQQYRQEFGNYLEAEAQRMKQIFFYSNNIGKNCKEASAQLRKMKYGDFLFFIFHLSPRNEYFQPR
ncbi:ankyrin repeat and SAM domain-containing protein 3-like [Clytia hemisphaerica]